MTRPLRVGTRASALALAQTRELLAAVPGGGATQIVPIVSDGDRTAASLASLGGTGVFVTTLRAALLAGEVDAIVHSSKDLPTAAAPGLEIAAFPARNDARDAVCSADGRSLEQLRAGARVGTGSPRRRAQVLAVRPDLDVVDLRGNVDTRLARTRTADDDPRRLDAVILAAAGLARLSRHEDASELLGLESWPTAPGQGALAVEIVTGAPTAAREIVAALDDGHTRVTVQAERAVLAGLQAGCAAPVAAHASVTDRRLVLHAVVYALDGSAQVGARVHGDLEPGVEERLAREVVDQLLDRGAAELAPLGAPR